MPFIGVQPASALLTSADIQDGQITTAKIANDAVDNTKLDLTSSYDFSAGLTLGDNLTFDVAGKGVHLGVTSSTASNLMDDYEEGEFEATLDNSVTLHPSQNSLSYTKIGRQVMICGQIRISSSNTNDVVINNLPFTNISATDNAEFTFGIVRLYEYNVPSDSKYVGCYTVASDTRLHFTNVRDNQATDPLNADQDGYLMFTTSYFAS